MPSFYLSYARAGSRSRGSTFSSSTQKQILSYQFHKGPLPSSTAIKHQLDSRSSPSFAISLLFSLHVQPHWFEVSYWTETFGEVTAFYITSTAQQRSQSASSLSFLSPQLVSLSHSLTREICSIRFGSHPTHTKSRLRDLAPEDHSLRSGTARGSDLIIQQHPESQPLQRFSQGRKPPHARLLTGSHHDDNAFASLML